jgi:hypothetical protein
MATGAIYRFSIHSQYRIYPSSRILPLIFAIIALSQIALAQKASSDASDPFDQVDAALQRAADQSLAHSSLRIMDSSVQKPVQPTTSVFAPLESSRETLSSYHSGSINNAALRLSALGVDARKIFEEEGVPAELLVVADVESRFNPAALSRKGAVGLWQLMPETARRYGLRVQGRIDDRQSPQRSTRAAARYLRDLHLRFGEWLLALAAYNAGEDTVQRAIDRGGSDDFRELSRLRLLPAETLSYVPAILESLGLHEDPGKNGRALPSSNSPSSPGILYATAVPQDQLGASLVAPGR